MERYQGAPLAQLRKLTINQIQLLNHAATVNHERSDEYMEWKKQFDDKDGTKPSKLPKGKGNIHKTLTNDLTEMPSVSAFKLMMGS